MDEYKKAQVSAWAIQFYIHFAKVDKSKLIHKWY